MARLNQNRTIILLIIYCVLGAYVLLSPHSGGGPDQKNADNQTLLPVSLEKVNRIAVQYKKPRPDLVFEQKDGAWFMTLPKHGKANPDHVRQLLGIFQYGYVEILAQAQQGSTAYGLDAPEIVLSLTSAADGQSIQTKVMFGQDSPSKAVCYCRVEGDPRIFTVGILYKRELEKLPEYFLRKSE